MLHMGGSWRNGTLHHEDSARQNRLASRMAITASSAPPAHIFLRENCLNRTLTQRGIATIVADNFSLCYAVVPSTCGATRWGQALGSDGQVLTVSIISYCQHQPKEVKMWLLSFQDPRVFRCGGYLTFHNAEGASRVDQHRCLQFRQGRSVVLVHSFPFGLQPLLPPSSSSLLPVGSTRGRVGACVRCCVRVHRWSRG